jgi:metal transporter CNNM
MAPLVLALMWLLSPVAWPTAKLLDYLLGEDHGTVYKKAGLKTLVTLHRTLGENTERLNQDEVTIISAVLDLKAKPIGDIMTPISDVFTLSLNTVLDETMMHKILSEGYSRIPIYAVNDPRDFVGMLLVKMLITYDPEDALRVRDFQLATLPETRPETSCLDIVNFFQEGKSHMVLVSTHPGKPRGALGVVTLEDVIEELIGEEIVDESDVFVDVHKAIRRLKPAPFSRIKRVEKGEVVTDPDPQVPYSEMEGEMDAEHHSHSRSRRGSYVGSDGKKSSLNELGRSPPSHTLFLRRRSSGGEQVAIRSDTQEMRQHLRAHLNPSNLASRPKSTRIGTVKIKPGVSQMAAVPETLQLPADGRSEPVRLQSDDVLETDDEANETTSLLPAGRHAKDGTQVLGYGATPSATAKASRDMTVSAIIDAQTNWNNYQENTSPSIMQQTTSPEGLNHARSSQSSISPEQSRSKKSSPSRSRNNTLQTPPKLVLNLTTSKEDLTRTDSRTDTAADGANDSSQASPPSTTNTVIAADKPPSRKGSVSTLGSLHSIDEGRKRSKARSGSITEQVIEVGGVRKIVLETTSSSDEHDDQHKNGAVDAEAQKDGAAEGGGGKKKKRKKRAGRKKKAASGAKDGEEESAPFLGGSKS